MKGLIEAIEKEGLKENVPQFNVGDTVKVGYRIIEGGKERIQNFEGVVIAKKHGGIRETFTVRRLSFGGKNLPASRFRRFLPPPGTLARKYYLIIFPVFLEVRFENYV